MKVQAVLATMAQPNLPFRKGILEGLRRRQVSTSVLNTLLKPSWGECRRPTFSVFWRVVAWILFLQLSIVRFVVFGSGGYGLVLALISASSRLLLAS